MHVLTVPNWSFGRNRDLLTRFRDTLDSADVKVHYCQADVDHNRTVTAFSGDWEPVRATLLELCEHAFPAIDLTNHSGVHPRIGALDVCPFLGDEGFLSQRVESLAETVAKKWGIPVYLYEKSERGRHEADLPALRKGGFGSLGEKTLRPDYGPKFAHPLLGVTIMGIRDPLIAMNANIDSVNLKVAQEIAKLIRDRRSDGDLRFLGVRALGLSLASQKEVQVSLNLTLPDVTPVDPIIDFIREQCARLKVLMKSTELIGVIRESDVATASWLPIKPEQIV